MGGRGSSGTRGTGSGLKKGRGGNKAIDARLDKYMQDTRLSSSSGTISRGQAGMLYRGIKNGDIKASNNSVSILYNRYTSSSPSHTTDRLEVDVANKFRVAVTAAANNDWKAANRGFDMAISAHHHYFTDKLYPDDRK